MNPLLSLIEKGINEHASAAIQKERCELLKEQFEDLERKLNESQRENSKLEAKLELAEVARDKAQRELSQLQKDHEEELVVHRGLEFKRGKRTMHKWLPFCPMCHGQVKINEAFGGQSNIASCTGHCARKLSKQVVILTSFPTDITLESILKELPE